MLKLTDYIGLGAAEYSDELIGLRLSTRLHIGGKAGPSYIDVLLSGVSPLALTNALGLNYIKALGATEQRNLPSEYTQVEYLESSGSQYIDTGIKPNGNYTVIIKGKYNNLGDGTKKMYGSRTGVGSKEFIFTASSQGGSVFTISYGTHTIDATGILSDTNIHIFKLSKGIGYVDDTVIKEFAQENFEGDYSLYLFGANYAGTVNGLSNTRIYYVEIYDGNFVLTQNLIPCSRNSDNVLGMYDTVTGTFFTNAGTGTFTAGADVVPSPDTPMDIICNNGVVKISKNLFDKNGEFIEFNTAADYIGIPVPNGTYTCSTNIPQQGVGDRNAWFDNQNETFSSTVNGVSNNNSRTVTTSNGYVYFAIRKSYKSGLLDGTYWVQIEKGSVATPYTPYSPNGIYTDGTQETVQVHSKNLYDQTTAENGYLTDTGDFNLSNKGKTSTFIQVKPSTTYTLKFLRTAQDIYTRVCSYDSNEDFVSLLIKDTDLTAGYKTETFTTDANAKYIRVSFKADSTEVQVEEGSTATSYEPYFDGGTANAEMLLKVGTYQDNQELLTGNVTRNVGIKVFDGTENWNFISGSTSRIQLSMPDALGDNTKTIYCSHFKYDATATAGDTCRVSVAKYLVFNLSASTTVNAFKQWLADQYNADTPVIVVYPTSSPVTETVTGQSLTASGNCTVTATGSLDNLSLEVSYKQGVTVRVREASNENLDNQVNVTIS